jgi:peptidyl-prolyl cis-trans isomerase SurA
MNIKQLVLGVLMASNVITYAQVAPKQVLFTVNDKPFYTDEFARVYNKNIELVKDESQKDLQKYLELYIGYKLKITKANDLGLQNAEKYKTELNGYRNQLAKNYLTDSKVTNELVVEGYNRMLKEIKASHILITCDENAAAADTLKAYNTAKEVVGKIKKGEDFGALAQQYSQDPSAKENKGLLGYFSAFRMVYAFENAAFNTKKGEVSKITRTRFGYHIIKVEDIRDNRGDLSVEHIMILKPAVDNKENNDKAESTIRDIYKKWQQGENFESLARTYSEDKASGPKGGLLQRFGSGQLSSTEFEEMAFSLSKENPVSAPFKSAFGWHIAKLIDRFPIKSMEEMKTELEEKIGKDERSRLVTASLTEKLKKKYSVKKDDKMYAEIQKAVTNDFYENKWETPANGTNFVGSLVTIDNIQNSGDSFLSYIKSMEKLGSGVKPVTKLVDTMYNTFVDEKLNTHYNENLEKEFPEFSNVMEEYRDGLLLFDLMEKEIWEKSKTDTIGLKKFYDLNKSKYNWKTRLDMSVCSSTNEEMVKQAMKMLKDGKTVEEIKTALNTKELVNIMASNGVYEEGNNNIPKGTKKDTGVSGITKNGEYYFVSKVNKVLPAGTKSLEDCKGKAINDYQQFLEENWVSNLKKEYTVKVNNDVFEKVKKEIQKK